jgi:undecaprenyl diphosphate synthase
MVVASSLCHHCRQRPRREVIHYMMASCVHNTTLFAWLATIILLLQAQCDAFCSFRSLKHVETRIHDVDRRTQIIQMKSTNTNDEKQQPNNHAVVVGVTIPQHVAFICDGNSKWAKANHVPVSVGHVTGANRLMDTIQTLQRVGGVQYVTFYAFSTENWQRPVEEINNILSIMTTTACTFLQKVTEDNNSVQIKILGDLQDERIPNALKEILWKLERDTSCQSSKQQTAIMTVCIAINYGGRQDILHASLRLAEAISSGQLDRENVTEQDFSSFLSTFDIPDPDLVIRTGGEQRLSNFLLWNSAYSELYFSNVMWPDFDDIFLTEALEWYSTRSRRFGGRNSQVVTTTTTTCTSGNPP